MYGSDPLGCYDNLVGMEWHNMVYKFESKYKKNQNGTDVVVSFPKVFSFPTDLKEKVGLSDKCEKQNMQCKQEKRKYSAVVSNWPRG